MRALCLSVALLALGCEDQIPDRPADLGPSPHDDMRAGPDLASADLAAPIEFLDFVLSLVNTQTSDSTSPTTTEDKAFKDSMDPHKLDVLFP